MPAYMIVACRIRDREAFVRGYAPAAGALVRRFGGEYVVAAAGATLLEGTLEGYGSVVVSKWPDRAAAEAFWTSADYAEVKKLRDGIADAEVLLVEAPG